MGDDCLPPSKLAKGFYDEIMATSSANCRISSNELDNAFHEGFPSTLYELLQEMSQVDRKMNVIPGTCSYQVHILFTSYVSLFVRAMSNEDKHKQKRACNQLQDVVKLLLDTEACYHTTLENYFEVEPGKMNSLVGSFAHLAMAQFVRLPVYSSGILLCRYWSLPSMAGQMLQPKL